MNPGARVRAMCGRFALFASGDELAERFQLALISTVLNSPTILAGRAALQANRMNNSLFPNHGIGVG
jgi:hypothetical protein